MEVFYAVDLAGRINGERDAVQTLVADDAHEAGGMERFASRTQNLQRPHSQHVGTLLNSIYSCCHVFSIHGSVWFSIHLFTVLVCHGSCMEH